MATVDSVTADQARIRALNDQLRQTLVGGQIVVTLGVRTLADDKLSALFKLLRAYNDFSPDNDPENEHDFGAIDLDGRRYLFKIDYFDPSFEGASEDPADPARTRRVLTLMRSDEY